MPEHVLEVAPKSAKVIFENDAIRVVLVTMKRGQKIPMHSHNKGFSYSLDGGKIRSTRPDGRSGVIRVKSGDFSWSERDGLETHTVENLGPTMRELCVELKG
jgi:quercetin dioxygenase-like cupin family protein